MKVTNLLNGTIQFVLPGSPRPRFFGSRENAEAAAKKANVPVEKIYREKVIGGQWMRD